MSRRFHFLNLGTFLQKFRILSAFAEILELFFKSLISSFINMTLTQTQSVVLAVVILVIVAIIAVKYGKETEIRRPHHQKSQENHSVNGKSVLGVEQTPRPYQNLPLDPLQREEAIIASRRSMLEGPPHPVLQYQREISEGIHPASYGDPIRVRDISGGPSGMYGGLGPVPGRPIGVQVPMGSMKISNERYNPGMFREATLDGFGPGSLQQNEFPHQRRPNVSGDFYRPYSANRDNSDIPFFGSVDSYAPFPAVESRWEKAGILTDGSRKGKKDEILNLFRRPIAPVQDVWEYQVQDKNGFIIKLEGVRYLEDGDIVPHVIGKSGLGPWKAHIFVQNKYIWM